MSLFQARRNYVAFGAVQPDLAATVRTPRVEELPAFVEWSSMGKDADERLVRDRGIKDACLHTAEALISGELGVIEGCATMAIFLSRLDSKELDERMRVFEVLPGWMQMPRTTRLACGT